MVDIAHMTNDGNPTTEKVIESFRHRISIRSSLWEKFAMFQMRGLVRNRQINECDTPWIMFGDSDMVYNPHYFERLVSELETNHIAATYMLSSGRMSNPKEQTNNLVDSYSDIYPEAINGAWSHADSLEKRQMRNCGAGFSQIINVRHCPHGGYYVQPIGNRDWEWSHRGSNPKSDMQFRRRVAVNGGPRRPLSEWFTFNAIHLNHDRDPEAGKHLETQR